MGKNQDDIMKVGIYIGFCFIFLFLACDFDKDRQDEIKELLNTLWTLEFFDIEGTILEPPKDQPYTIQFRDDSIASGKVDCNYLDANYLIASDNSLRLEQLRVTEMGCGGDQSISNRYILALEDAKSYEIHNKYLYIYYGDHSRLFDS